ncbi:MAG: cytochrome c oxidase assembly protein [Gemmatimonadota bacterium]|nr:cytochrome c oxidase assembly protein [Gemmatimonadota bacterium]
MASNVQWWCSAQGTRWTWNWRAYPGIWLVALAIAGGYWAAVRGGPDTPSARRRRAIGWAGVVLAWLSLDWPLGPLATGYLASAHALQFLLLTMVVSPLILVGLAPGLAARPEPAGWWWRVLRVLTSPLVAAIIFNIIAGATHVPAVVDGFMVSQLGSFALDLSWIVAGLALWWPIVMSRPARQFPVPFKLLYLFLATLIHSGIAVVMLFAEFPIYGIYQLAPPMRGLTPMTDLQIAGGIMELGGLVVVFGVMTGLFFTWANRSAADDGA